MKDSKIIHAFKSFDGNLFLFLKRHDSVTARLIRMPPPFSKFDVVLSMEVTSAKVTMVQAAAGAPIYLSVGEQNELKNVSWSMDGVEWAPIESNLLNYRVANGMTFALGPQGSFYVAQQPKMWWHNEPGIVSHIQSLWWSPTLQNFILPTDDAIHMSNQGQQWRTYKLQLRSLFEQGGQFYGIEPSSNSIVQTSDFIQIRSFPAPGNGERVTAFALLTSTNTAWAATVSNDSTDPGFQKLRIYSSSNIQVGNWTETPVLLQRMPWSEVISIQCTAQYCVALVSSYSGSTYRRVRWFPEDREWLHLPSDVSLDGTCRLDILDSNPPYFQHSCEDPRIPNWFSVDGWGWGVNSQFTRYTRWIPQDNIFVGSLRNGTLVSGATLQTMTSQFSPPIWPLLIYDYVARSDQNNYVAVSTFDNSIFVCQGCNLADHQALYS